ncbi:lasso peptide biosynthesis B2 protein [Haloplanus ruber]|uniref:Lasso peptide biosynthesis B2 protein n=1 Tax=Haloplanus ruber TaxID=869892 RepID=A0ABD6CZB1_9EURY|nr:lasso peptide biosynthesis B2 protein [Haloplanus ruber]
MLRITRFLSLSSGDKFRVLCSALLLLLTSFCIVLLPFSKVRAGLLRISTPDNRRVPGTPPPSRIVWAVNVTEYYLPGSRSCLVRSLAGETLLRLYGYAPTHRIGVNPHSEDGFIAHSWLEYDGDVLIGDLDDLSQYEPLPPLDGGGNP